MKVTIRRSNDPHIDFGRMAAADPLDLPLLQYPQQLDLRIQRQFSDFVQEDRSAIRQLKPSDAAL